MYRTSCLLVLAIFLTWFWLQPTASGQSREATEQRLRALQDQMTLDVIRISETEELEKASLETLSNLDRQIAVREELINTNQVLLRQIERTRDSLATSLVELEKELTFHRSQYQDRAVHAYKYGRLHDVALILAAQSINQMLIRIRYLNRFADQRRGRLNQILESTRKMEERRAEIDAHAEEAQKLIAQATSEQSNLKQLRVKRSEIISELKNQRSSLQHELENEQLEAQRLENLIRQIISNESSRRSNVPANPVTAAANAQLSGSFMANRGNMPWPAQGAIIEPFGEVINPVYGTRTNNPGILIATPPSAPVNAVFDGEVIEILQMPEFGRVITISHGEYTTLYGNLSLLYEAAGSKVRAGQLIGRGGTEAEPKGNAVFFGIFQNGLEINPVQWLTR